MASLFLDRRSFFPSTGSRGKQSSVTGKRLLNVIPGLVLKLIESHSSNGAQRRNKQ